MPANLFSVGLSTKPALVKVSGSRIIFSRSRRSRYCWYDALLCAAPLLVVNNAIYRCHGCSDFSTLYHHMSMETSPSSLLIAVEAFKSNIFHVFQSRDETRETTVGGEIDRKTSSTFVTSWLNAAGTSHNILSLIWCHSMALSTSPSYIILRCLLRRSPPPSRNTIK